MTDKHLGMPAVAPVGKLTIVTQQDLALQLSGDWAKFRMLRPLDNDTRPANNFLTLAFLAGR